MNEKINHYLHELEKEKNIKILLACETGSRAWGFPSPDSDYDIRIIYQHEKDWYLALNDKKDSIQRMYENNDLDITGWNLRKCMHLLMKSNPALLERIQSHIIYQADETFLTEFKNLAQTAYSRIATLYHYLSMAKKLFADIKDEEQYKLKQFFYVLRSTIACIWILEKDEMPPIDFQKMLASLDLPKDLITRINELIELKAMISESYLHTGESEIISFIEKELIQAGRKSKQLPSSQFDIEEFNQFFIHQLNR
jgi:predicted nucleotidyltransferase